MKVCLDCRSIGAGSGGIGSFAARALEALQEHPGGNDYLVALRREQSGGLRERAGFSRLTPGNTPFWGEMELPVVLEEHDIDVFFSPLFVCPVVRSARHVITLHDVFPESHPELCTPEFMGSWRARIGPSLRSGCHAAAVSEWSRTQAAEKLKLDPERVSVLRQSVGERFRRAPRRDLEPALARCGVSYGQYILYVGALDPRKNLERLIRAFGRLDSGDLKLVIAGGQVVEEYDLEAVVMECGLEDRVKFPGYVPDGDLVGLYSGACCFAFPSLAEGFGRPCVEAMSCGVPVVASDRTALPETCGDAALLPDAGDEAAIAGALEKACFDEGERKRLVAAGYVRAAEFAPERFASDLVTTFEAALKGPAEGLWPA